MEKVVSLSCSVQSSLLRLCSPRRTTYLRVQLVSAWQMGRLPLSVSLSHLWVSAPHQLRMLGFYSHGLFDGRRHGAGMSSATPAAVIIPTASTGNATRAVTEQRIRKTPLSYMELLGPLTPGSPFTASPDLESGPARVWGDGSVGVLVSVFFYLRYAPPTGKRKLC